MPNRRQLGGADGTPGAIERRTPSSWVADGGTWPIGPFYADTPLEVLFAAEIAVNLGQALQGHVKVAVARQANLARSTIYDILGGRTWPDFVSLVKLGHELDTNLWPSRTPELPHTSSKRP